MRATAEVVIVGAGIVGASTAYWLTESGLRDVVIVEQRVPAAGATGKSGALVRLHYPNPHETRLAFESLRFFQEWEARLGTRSPFVRTGFLQIVAPSDEEKLQANVAMQQALGAPVELLTAEQVAELEPWCDVRGSRLLPTNQRAAMPIRSPQLLGCSSGHGKTARSFASGNGPPEWRSGMDASLASRQAPDGSPRRLWC